MNRLRAIVVAIGIGVALPAATAQCEEGQFAKVRGDATTLSGMWTVKTLADEDGKWDKPGYAAISGRHGLISNAAGTAPFVFQFRVANVRNQRWIDLDVPGAGNSSLYGIYELDEEQLKLCFATEEIIAIHGRPESFSAADPQMFTKLVLSRVPAKR